MNYNRFKEDLCSLWLPHNSYSISSLYDALKKIALKYFPVIPRRKIFQCQNLENALQLLEKWNLLSYKRLAVLIELSDLLLGPTDTIKVHLLKLNPNYMNVSFCNCYDGYFVQSLPQSIKKGSNGPVGYQSVYAEVYQYLSENLGMRWIDLGRSLPGMRNRTEELCNDITLRQKDKIWLLLEEFEMNCGGSNVLEQLTYSLNLCKLRRQSDHIRRKFSSFF